MIGVRLAAASALVGACAAAIACSSGTTPDCSDAQCLVVQEVTEAGDEGVADARALDAAPADGADAHHARD
jgi:hypothetical protein